MEHPAHTHIHKCTPTPSGPPNFTTSINSLIFTQTKECSKQGLCSGKMQN